MSNLARIFVVFNLVLAVAFFGSSATLYLNREHWREAYLSYRKQARDELDRVEKRFQVQKNQLNEIAKDNRALTASNAALTTKIGELQAAQAKLEQDLKDAQLTVQKHLNALTEAQKTIQAKESAIQAKDTLIASLRQKEEQARAAQQKAVQDVTRLKLDYDKLQELHSQELIASKDLQDKLESYEIMIAAAKSRGIDITSFRVPYIDGIVEAVNEKDRLVVLSVGKDQKVEPGYPMFVHRGGEYIGKLEVIRVYEDLSGARIVYTVDGKTVQVGDRVKTVQ